MAPILENSKVTYNWWISGRWCLAQLETAGICGYKMKRKLHKKSTLLQLFQLDQLHDDLSHFFRTTQPVCQNVTLKENWMIRWNIFLK